MSERIIYRVMRESFGDIRRSIEIDWRSHQMLQRRLLRRPFWMNISRSHQPYRLPFFDAQHWRILADGMTTRGWTARECYHRWGTNRRHWMPRRITQWSI